MNDVSKTNITQVQAEKLAISIGAVKVGTYSPCLNTELLFNIEPYKMFDHYFNKDGNEVGYYSYNFNSFNDTRTWNENKNYNGRIWCSTYKQNLINRKKLNN